MSDANDEDAHNDGSHWGEDRRYSFSSSALHGITRDDLEYLSLVCEDEDAATARQSSSTSSAGYHRDSVGEAPREEYGQRQWARSTNALLGDNIGNLRTRTFPCDTGHGDVTPIPFTFGHSASTNQTNDCPPHIHTRKSADMLLAVTATQLEDEYSSQPKARMLGEQNKRLREFMMASESSRQMIYDKISEKPPMLGGGQNAGQQQQVALGGGQNAEQQQQVVQKEKARGGGRRREELKKGNQNVETERTMPSFADIKAARRKPRRSGRSCSQI